MAFDFDKIIERRGSNSIKWARHGRDTLPLWVADMDFRAPEPLLEALRRVVDHGVLGYDSAPRSLLETVAARMERLHGWKVDPDWVVPVTGVVSGFYAAISATCGPGRKAHVIQPPVYMPFNDLERHLGSPRREAPLEMETAREGSGAAPPSIEYNIKCLLT